MINMFISNEIYLSFVYFMPWPEFPMGICSVGAFPMQSGGSVINFPGHLGVKKLAIKGNF